MSFLRFDWNDLREATPILYTEFLQILTAHFEQPNRISFWDLPDNRLFSFEQQQQSEDDSSDDISESNKRKRN